ncbi:hypothetical protein [Alienimonas chondri]|uniref:DUF2066 domain-containing protein n=1 Tax=Alienimonas chondri TaxID=2681879 RepID=A0ABX1VHB7_9PLAN|nr:hypothetical protein [Alienimonas chondri]NNJ27494.1 hypothetical protein [Alienimonas chondri]
MTARLSRRPSYRAIGARATGWMLLAATMAGGPAVSEVSAQERNRAGYGPSMAERRAAVRLAQRERDAARRRPTRPASSGYSFGDFSGGVPNAALSGPREMAGGRVGDERSADGLVTQVRVVVLVDGAAGVLGTRRWRESLAALGADTSVRTGRPGDSIGVTENVGVGLRTVIATGRLTSNGALEFPGQSFQPSDRQALSDWVDSLTTHGAAGDPNGQPLWGLSQTQFRAVFTALSAPSPAEFVAVSDGPIGPALLALELPPTLPVRFSAAAKAKLAGPDPALGDGALPAFSKGAALAAALARRGLAFHPARTPAGSLELAIDLRPPGDELTAIPGTAEAEVAGAEPPAGAWPVGWRTAAGPGRLAAAGGLFTLTTLGVRESTLNDFAKAVEAESGVPVVMDVAALRSVGVDPAADTVSVPPGRGTWDKAVRYAVAEHALKSELRRDEAGHGFLWVTPARR